MQLLPQGLALAICVSAISSARRQKGPFDGLPKPMLESNVLQARLTHDFRTEKANS
jgi:hypothetical protein